MMIMMIAKKNEYEYGYDDDNDFEKDVDDDFEKDGDGGFDPIPAIWLRAPS